MQLLAESSRMLLRRLGNTCPPKISTAFDLHIHAERVSNIPVTVEVVRVERMSSTRDDRGGRHQCCVRGQNLSEQNPKTFGILKPQQSSGSMSVLPTMPSKSPSEANKCWSEAKMKWESRQPSE